MSSHSSFTPLIHVANNVYIKPTHFIITPQWDRVIGKRSQKQREAESNLKNNRRNPSLSTKSISNLRASINWLKVSAQYKKVWVKESNKSFWFKLNFITLTIPPQLFGCVSEKDFQKVLNVWLVYARKYFYLCNYVWKIEAHEDGRLHVHITTDTFINYRKLRTAWNRILQKNGLLELHYAKFGYYDPNSTDVHAVHKVDNVAAYICEYMVKKPNLPDGFKGRIWGCSYSLSAKMKCTAELEPVYNKRDYSFMNSPAIKYKPIESKPDSMGNVRKIADMYLLGESDWDKHMTGLIKDAYNDRRKRIRDGTIKPPKEYMQIDFLAFKNVNEKVISKQEFSNFTPCEIKHFTPKIGLIQLDLQF